MVLRGPSKSPETPAVQGGGSDGAVEEYEKAGNGGGTSTLRSSTASSTSTTEAVNGGAGGSENQLLGEVTSLLRSLRAPQPATRALIANHEAQGALLDSGATHMLRAPRTGDEWACARETIAQTATGDCVLRQTDSGALLSRDKVAPIIPLGIDWKPGQCRLRHPHIRVIEVNVVSNCLYMDGEKLMKCLENKSLQIRNIVKALVVGEEEQGQDWLIDPKTLRNKFPLVPLKHIAKPTRNKEEDCSAPVEPKNEEGRPLGKQTL